MKKIILTCLFFLFFKVDYANGNETFDFAKVADTPDQAIGGKILEVIYSKLHIKANIISYPGSRASEEASKGRIAGEVHRIYAYGEQHPTLIRITPAINYIQPTVFSKNINIKIDGWKSLSKYRIGIIRGIVYSEVGTKGMPDVTVLNSIEQLALMVISGRIDLFVTDKYDGMLTLKRMMATSEIKPLSPPIVDKIELYHYIHQSHKDLVPKIEKIINDMTKNGELETLRQKLRKELLEKGN